MKKKKPVATIDVSKAHYVRDLRACAHCDAIGDLKYMPMVKGKHVHGFCALEILGSDGLLKLPQTELNKISLGEVGRRVMIKLCNGPTWPATPQHTGKP